MLAQLAVGRTLGGGTLVVTHPLAAVVRAFCRSLTMALNGKMGGAAGTCFLLVGKRGTGKTSLLAALSGKGGALARAVGGGRVATLRLSMAHYHRSHPVRHLEVWLDFETPPLSEEEEEEDPEHTEAALRAANAKLTAENKVLVLLLDDYHGAYVEEHGNCGAWRSLMRAIPSLAYGEKRRIFAIVSGMSAWLCAFALGKVPVADVSRNFPGYTHASQRMSLNSQEYVCTYLDNFSLADCKRILNVLDVAAERLEEVYCYTGGVPRLMEDYIRHSSSRFYTRSVLAAVGKRTLLRTMAAMLDEDLRRTGTVCPTSERLMMHKLAVHDVKMRMEREGRPLRPMEMNSAAHDMLICFHDSDQHVTFAVPILAAYVVHLVRAASSSRHPPHLQLPGLAASEGGAPVLKWEASERV